MNSFFKKLISVFSAFVFMFLSWGAHTEAFVRVYRDSKENISSVLFHGKDEVTKLRNMLACVCRIIENTIAQNGTVPVRYEEVWSLIAFDCEDELYDMQFDTEIRKFLASYIVGGCRIHSPYIWTLDICSLRYYVLKIKQDVEGFGISDGDYVRIYRFTAPVVSEQSDISAKK